MLETEPLIPISTIPKCDGKLKLTECHRGLFSQASLDFKPSKLEARCYFKVERNILDQIIDYSFYSMVYLFEYRIKNRDRILRRIFIPDRYYWIRKAIEERNLCEKNISLVQELHMMIKN